LFVLLTETQLPLIHYRNLHRVGIVHTSLDTKEAVTRCALFEGDLPPVYNAPVVGRLQGDTVLPRRARNFVCSQDYANPRPLRSSHQNILYTPEGYAWTGGQVDLSLSARPVWSTKGLLKDRLRRGRKILDQGTIIESKWPVTYGDWLISHIKTIALCPDFPRPLVLPNEISARSYVRRELDQLGIEVVAADCPVLIREATVIHRPSPSVLWRPEDTVAYRKLYGITPPAPRKGSILYLSRIDVNSDQKAAVRDYRSATVGKIVESLGARVIETGSMGRDDYAKLANEAETVIADHGSAAFNLLQWKTRNLIEIVTSNWWCRSIIFLGAASGVENHAVVLCDIRTESELADEIEKHLRAFGALP
jgi:capsular polysaccharide biosynthesis protein